MIAHLLYEQLPLIAVIWLTARYYYLAPASDWAKRRLCGLTALAVLSGLFAPLAAALAQLAIGVYIVLYQTVAEEGFPSQRGSG